MARPQKRVEDVLEALDIPPVPADAWVLAPSPVRLADGAFDPIESPARQLQADLAASFAEQSAAYPRWSARRSMAVIATLSLSSWMVLFLVVRALFF